MRAGRANGREWLRLGEAAASLGVSLNTLRRWSDSGRLVCYRSAGGHRRYRRLDVEALLSAQSRESPEGRADRRPPAFTDEGGDLTRLRASLAVLARVAAEGIGATSCVFAFLADAARLRVIASYGPSEGSPPEGAVVHVDAMPAASEVLRTGRRLVIADVSTTSLLSREAVETYRRDGNAALLGLPLTLDGRLAGVMLISDQRSPRAFTGANVAFATFVARQAALLLPGHGPPGAEDEPVDPRLSVERPVGPLLARAPGELARAPHNRLRDLVASLSVQLDAVACDVLHHDEAEGVLSVVASAVSDDDESALEGECYSADAFADFAQVLAGDTVTLHDLAERVAAGSPLLRHGHRGARSALLAPLRFGDEALGVLVVFDAEPQRAFGVRERTLVGAAAALAAVALHDRVTGGAQRADGLDDLISGVTASAPLSDPEPVVRATLRVVRTAFDLAVCAVYIVDDGAATDLATVPPAAAVDRWQLHDYPPAVTAVETRSPAVVRDAQDPQLTGDASVRFLSARGLTGVVLSPLVYGDTVVGLLEVGSATPSRTDALIEYAGVLADLLAQLIGGARALTALQRRSRDLVGVVEVGLGGPDRQSVDDLLRAVVQRLADITHASIVEVLSVENATLRSLVCYHGGQFDPEWEDVAIALRRYPCSRRAVESGETIAIRGLDDPALDEEARYSLEKWGYQSLLSVPLVSAGRVIGLVELSDYVPREFEADSHLVRGLCGIAARVLETASLVDQAERRNRILGELVALGDLASRAPDVQTLQRDVAQRLQAALDAANCDIFRATDEGLRCVASFDRSGYDERPVGALLDVRSFPTVAAAMARRQVLIVTSPDDPRLSDGERRAYREYGYASEVCVPLVTDGELHGFIDICDTRERDYTEYLSFLRSAAFTLAGAVRNALLAETVARLSGMLREVADLGKLAAGSRGVEETFRELAERVRVAVAAADCDIYTLQSGRLRCVVSADRDGYDESVVGGVLDMDRFPATAMAARGGTPMEVSRPDDPRLTVQERENMAAYGYQSELCIPLMAGEQVIGLIDVFDTRPRDYGDYEGLLSSAAQVATGIIRNAARVGLDGTDSGDGDPPQSRT